MTWITKITTPQDPQWLQDMEDDLHMAARTSTIRDLDRVDCLHLPLYEMESYASSWEASGLDHARHGLTLIYWQRGGTLDAPLPSDVLPLVRPPDAPGGPLPSPYVYIAAPYANEDPQEVALNVARACALARLAVEKGLAPICVHPGIAPVYGTEETPALRAKGIAVDVALVGLVAGAGGALWLLWADEGPPVTEGVTLERAAFGTPEREVGGSWRRWFEAFDAAGLGALWHSCTRQGGAEPELERLRRLA